MHRFVWDLHEAGGELPQRYPIAAIVRDTPSHPAGPWAVPGRYTVRLTVDGRTLVQPLTVRMDPRVRMTPEELLRQRDLARELIVRHRGVRTALSELSHVRTGLAELAKGRGESPPKEQADALASASTLAQTLTGLLSGADGLARLPAELASLYDQLQGVDRAPTAAWLAAWQERSKTAQELTARWQSLRVEAVPALNERLRKAGLAELKLP